MNNKQTPQQVYDENQTADQFGVSQVGFHTHNGSDSPLISPNNLTGYTVFATVPTKKGFNGQIILVGSSSTYSLYVFVKGVWVQLSSPPTTPAGSNTQLQFNDGGVFGGNSQLTFDKSTDTFTAGSSSLAVFNGKLKLPVGTNLYP